MTFFLFAQVYFTKSLATVVVVTSKVIWSSSVSSYLDVWFILFLFRSISHLMKSFVDQLMLFLSFTHDTDWSEDEINVINFINCVPFFSNKIDIRLPSLLWVFYSIIHSDFSLTPFWNNYLQRFNDFTIIIPPRRIRFFVVKSGWFFIQVFPKKTPRKWNA